MKRSPLRAKVPLVLPSLFCRYSSRACCRLLSKYMTLRRGLNQSQRNEVMRGGLLVYRAEQEHQRRQHCRQRLRHSPDFEIRLSSSFACSPIRPLAVHFGRGSVRCCCRCCCCCFVGNDRFIIIRRTLASTDDR